MAGGGRRGGDRGRGHGAPGHRRRGTRLCDLRRGVGLRRARLSSWSRAARLYDLQLALERRALRTLVAMMEITPADTVLDVGTGTGGLLRELARAEARPARAIGVDGSDAMLARARAVVPAGTELLRADARALPLPDASVEAVTAAYLLHLLSPHVRAEVLRELGRVLVPGGRLGVVTVAPPGPGLVSRLVSAPIRAAAARSSGPLAGLRPLDPADDLRRAGFGVEAVRRTVSGYPSLCVRAGWPGRPAPRSS